MEIETRRQVQAIVAAVLVRADAKGRIPTPLDDVMEVAGLQEPRESLLAPRRLAELPIHLRAAVGKLLSRVRGLLDRRALEVHLDPTVSSQGRRRFIKGHEIAHQILPWQRDLAYADDDYRLAPDIRLSFELEANLGSAELLYQGGAFADDASALRVGMASVIALAQRYQVSLESALWRYVETSRSTILGVVLDPSPTLQTPLRFKRHQLIRSVPFAVRFGSAIWPSQLGVERYSFVTEAAAASMCRVPVAGEWHRRDLAGLDVTLRTECFRTGYAILVLAWIDEKQSRSRRVRLTA